MNRGNTVFFKNSNSGHQYVKDGRNHREVPQHFAGPKVQVGRPGKIGFKRDERLPASFRSLLDNSLSTAMEGRRSKGILKVDESIVKFQVKHEP
jgi:hypothetical protein